MINARNFETGKIYQHQNPDAPIVKIVGVFEYVASPNRAKGVALAFYIYVPLEDKWKGTPSGGPIFTMGNLYGDTFEEISFVAHN